MSTSFHVRFVYNDDLPIRRNLRRANSRNVLQLDAEPNSDKRARIRECASGLGELEFVDWALRWLQDSTTSPKA